MWNVIYSSGVNTWRDQLRPTQLLQNVARFKGFPPPILSEDGNRIRYGGRDYSLDEFGKCITIDCKLVTKCSNLSILRGPALEGGMDRVVPSLYHRRLHTQDYLTKAPLCQVLLSCQVSKCTHFLVCLRFYLPFWS